MCRMSLLSNRSKLFPRLGRHNFRPVGDESYSEFVNSDIHAKLGLYLRRSLEVDSFTTSLISARKPTVQFASSQNTGSCAGSFGLLSKAVEPLNSPIP